MNPIKNTLRGYLYDTQIIFERKVAAETAWIFEVSDAMLNRSESIRSSLLILSDLSIKYADSQPTIKQRILEKLIYQSETILSDFSFFIDKNTAESIANLLQEFGEDNITNRTRLTGNELNIWVNLLEESLELKFFEDSPIVRLALKLSLIFQDSGSTQGLLSLNRYFSDSSTIKAIQSNEIDTHEVEVGK